MNNIAYNTTKAMGLLAGRTFFRLKIEGKKNIPQRGPVIIASNHRSWADPPLLSFASPRKVYFMAKEELFRIPLLGPGMRVYGAFPVSSRGIGAFRESIRKLREDKVIGIFPEGKIGRLRYDSDKLKGEVGKLKEGVVRIAIKAESSIIPAGIRGSGTAVPRDAIPRFRTTIRFTPITVRFGRPINPGEIMQSRKKTATGRLAEKLRDEIKQLIKE